MIREVKFHRFKQFRRLNVVLGPGLSLLAGGNNAGKTSFLHGLAIWQFCKTAIEMERGADTFLEGASKQGLGLGDEEFSPISVPTLKHLWTNLRTAREDEVDGYTLKIKATWDGAGDAQRVLEFGLSLVNDRLFIKTTESNLTADDRIPSIAYLPPFAGITDREIRMPEAIRRRRIGEGLAGSILRNVLLDLYTTNQSRREQLRADRSKILDRDLKELRQADPWERLQELLRKTFRAELDIAPFREEYHSYIRVHVAKGELQGSRFKRHTGYNKRDLMVEGSGFLQWLSVLALVFNPNIDVVLLDEPDSHLHFSLQEQLIEFLAALGTELQKQILVATHATDILRAAPSTQILEIRGSHESRYLRSEDQKVGLLAGLGTDYAPRIDRIRRRKRVLFTEGRSDIPILTAFAATLGMPISDVWTEWRTTYAHRDRKKLFMALSEEIPALVSLSLRDRDEEPLGTVGERLADLSFPSTDEFQTRKWRRRHIESYLVWPPAIADAGGIPVEEVEIRLRDDFAIAVPPDGFVQALAPEALMNLNGRDILFEGEKAILRGRNLSAADVAGLIPAEHIPQDVRELLEDLRELARDQS